MVRHQAKSQVRHAGCGQRLAEQTQVHFMVVISKEYLLSSIASLRDVVRETGDDDACEASHRATGASVSAEVPQKAGAKSGHLTCCAGAHASSFCA